MFRTDAVDSSRVSYCEGGRSKLVRCVVGRVAQPHQTRPVHAKHVLEARQIWAHHLFREVVVSGGHRGVRREDGRVADVLECLLRPEAVALNQVGCPCDDEESAVPFVHVENVGFDVELRQQLIAAEAQNHLLPQAMGDIPTVQSICDRAILRPILRHVGVEQIQRDPSDLELPGPHLHGAGW